MEHATDENFNKLTSEGLVLVDFYATWCGPCQMLKRELEELDGDDRFKLVKVDVDEAEQTSNKFNIDAVPNVFLLKDGKVVDSFMGYRTAEDMLSWLKPHLK